jgi:hypothetical protein
MADPYITVKLVRGKNFGYAAEVREIINGSPKPPTIIPQRPRNPHEIKVGEFNGDEIKIDVLMEGGADPKTIWHFNYDDNAPESVTVTIGDDR